MGRKQNIAKRNVANLPVLVLIYSSRLLDRWVIFSWFLNCLFILFILRRSRLLLSMVSYSVSLSIIWFCMIQIIMTDSVDIHTVMADNIRGFAPCNNSAPVKENPSGLRIGGTRGAKNIIIHNIQNWSTIISFDIKKGAYFSKDKLYY